MEIGGLQKTTLIDYPGKVACTVFLIGCNFRCPWCYSPELVLPEKIKTHPRISEQDFFGFLKKRKHLLEGVVICGGEATIQKDLPKFIKRIKNLGFFVKLDTNGSNPSMIKKLCDNKLIDYVAMDIKALLKPQNYSLATGVKLDMEKVRKSIRIIKGSGCDYEFRTTVVPTIHTKEDIEQIAREINDSKKYYLQSFLAEKTINPEFEKIRPYQKEFLLDVKKKINSFFNNCEVRK